jgi:Tol biopolymer transport system component
MNTEFFYAKLDVEQNDITFFPFDIARDASIKMVKTIWSPFLSKVAVLAADPMLPAGYIKMKFICYDLQTRKKQEVPTDLYTFPLQDWINPQWTPDEKSVLIKAQPIKMHPRGIFKIDFSTQSTSEYLMEGKTWSAFAWNLRWLQFSPNGKTQYFASTEDSLSYPTKLLARTIETGNENIIRQFDKEPDKFFLSPDGNMIAVIYDNSLLAFKTDGSAETKILQSLDKNWGALLGWSADSKSLFIKKPAGKESWTIRRVTFDGKESGDLFTSEKLKPFFGASNLLMHYVNGNTYLSMQNGKRINELWAVENIVQK